VGNAPHIVVVGSHGPGLFVRVKRIPVPGETVPGWQLEAPVDGGKGSNQAVAAARLGARVNFVGCVGQDELGEVSLRWLAEAKVDVTHVSRSPTAATLGGFVLLDDDGIPAIVSLPGAGVDLTTAHISDSIHRLSQAQVLLTQFEIPADRALFAAHLGRELGLLTIVNPSPAPSGGLPGLEAADVLVPNETEALALLGLDPGIRLEAPRLAERVWRQSGAGCALVTLGERGVAYAGPDGVWEERAPAAQAVDTTGAGDAFCGALAVALGQGQPPRAAAHWACAVAACSTTRRGTMPAFPTAVEVEAFLAGFPGAAARPDPHREQQPREEGNALS
jgi:ribokinase